MDILIWQFSQRGSWWGEDQEWSNGSPTREEDWTRTHIWTRIAQFSSTCVTVQFDHIISYSRSSNMVYICSHSSSFLSMLTASPRTTQWIYASATRL